MTPKILFIGSIGTVAETSELQRQSYNQALKENGISWEWTPEVYHKLLKSNGGQDRLDMLSMATGQELTDAQIKKIHTRKTQLACQHIIDKKIQPRPGLTDLIAQAKQDGAKVAWVTTTGTENTTAILEAAGEALSASDFDHIFHRNDAENGKPSPDIYKVALKHYGVKASECIAIEDSLNSVISAKGACIFSVVTPGAYHVDDINIIADMVFDDLDKTSWASLKEAFNNAEPQKRVA